MLFRSQAGRKGAITIATNMAGRGTDIVLGGNVEKQTQFIEEDDAIPAEEKARLIQKLKDEWLGLHEQVKAAGASFLRGGAFKPRSSPYSFQGMGLDGLKLLKEVGDRTGLLIISEVMEISQIDLMLPYVDVLQVGARNMQNFNLLREIGLVRKPVLLKRGIAATLEELLLSAEYILAGGNYDVMLCERGIRTFETYTRNTMDISAIPVIKKLSHLPMLADPSHGVGRRDKVAPMARAAVAAGCDGLLIEVHPNPDKALSDGAQSLFPEQFDKLMDQLRIIATAVNRNIRSEIPVI